MERSDENETTAAIPNAVPEPLGYRTVYLPSGPNMSQVLDVFWKCFVFIALAKILIMVSRLRGD